MTVKNDRDDKAVSGKAAAISMLVIVEVFILLRTN